MNINARSDYAIRALVELSRGTTSSREIAQRQDISHQFLAAILTDLRKGGLVEARRGSGGGYRLALEPESISLADVIRTIDGPLASINGQAPETRVYPEGTTRLRDVWVAVRASIRRVLEEVTVADVVRGELPDVVRELLAEDDAWHRR
jgi:Rrf2 family protein